jgi:hypothetical protein
VPGIVIIIIIQMRKDGVVRVKVEYGDSDSSVKLIHEE